jgi:hypothetical protein
MTDSKSYRINKMVFYLNVFEDNITMSIEDVSIYLLIDN